jgi:hypothetical protein
LSQLRSCIARGLDSTAEERARVDIELDQIRKVAATVDAKGDPYDVRLEQFDRLARTFSQASSEHTQRMAALMLRWKSGLFIGDGAAEQAGEAWAGDSFLPEDNYALERHFRTPKHHMRHIHGRAHAGVVIVQRGATLIPTLDAHLLHPTPFSYDTLRPYLHAPEPPRQREACARAAIMRRARSLKQRPILLAELKARYLNRP